MQPELRYSSRTAQTGLALGRNKVLRNTYWMLGLTMIPTLFGAMIGMSTNFSFLAQAPVMGPLVMLAVMMGLLFGVSATRNSMMGIALLFLFTFVAGWWLGPMLQYALNFKNGAQIIGTAAAGTGMIFFTLAGIATVTKKDFGFMQNFLFVGLVLLIIASIANIALSLVFSLFLISRVPSLVSAWPRMLTDLICSQLLIALIAPWFFALQAGALDIARPLTSRYGRDAE